MDAVSETLRCEWDKVWNLPALEFLNLLAYRRDKQAEEKAKIEKWKKNH